MLFRRALPADYPNLERIASENSFDNLSEAGRAQGFLTGNFTAASFAAIANSLALIVADDHGTLGGFMCATRIQNTRGRPIIAALLAACEHTEFQRKPLSQWRLFIYGPVCVARSHRGQGLLKGMFTALETEVTNQFDVGVGFVDRANPGSLRAHVQSLGMTTPGQFQFNKRGYQIIAFACRA
jgi:hypothetical protein